MPAGFWNWLQWVAAHVESLLLAKEKSLVNVAHLL